MSHNCCVTLPRTSHDYRASVVNIIAYTYVVIMMSSEPTMCQLSKRRVYIADLCHPTSRIPASEILALGFNMPMLIHCFQEGSNMIFHSLTFERYRWKCFQPSRGTLRMLMNDKIMFYRYYCINSANHCENEETIGALYFITSSHFPTRVRF